jgi:putative hydrolase of the HAD superfamily
MIKAVIFDFGNVLCTFDLRRFLDRALQYTDHTMHELMAKMPALSRASVRYETGLMSSDEYFREISRIGDLRMPREEFIGAYSDIFTPVPDVFALIKSLKGSHRLGLLSNTNEWHFLNSIRPLEIFPLFDAVTLSYEVGAMKPAPAIYGDMLQKLSLPSAECAYIDDLPENVDAASRLGMHSLLFTSPEALRADLRQVGIQV